MPVRTLSPTRFLDPSWLLGMSDGGPPAVENHPNLGGVFDQSVTGATLAPSRRGGSYSGSVTGGRFNTGATGGEVL